MEESLGWVCGRCGQRQAREGECRHCRRELVLDLDRPQVRELLQENEQRARDAREGRLRGISVGSAMAIVVVAWFIPGYWTLRGFIYPGLPFLFDQWLLMVAIAIGLLKVLEKKLDRPLYPWLAGLPPPSKPYRDPKP